MGSQIGYILRKNEDNKYVLQSYTKADGYPDIDAAALEQKYSTLEQAMLAYQEISATHDIEYGLKVDMTLFRPA